MISVQYCTEIKGTPLSADLGLTPEVREDFADYIGSWLEVLKDDKRVIFSAAAHAQRAADFLNGLQPEPEASLKAEQRNDAGYHPVDRPEPG